MEGTSKLRLLQGKLKTLSDNGYYYETTDRQIYEATIGEMQYDAVVTLNTYEPLSEDQTATLVRLCQKRLDEKLKCKLDWAHFYELKKGNAHCHSFVSYKQQGIGKQQFNAAARHIWAKLTRKHLAEHKARNGRDKARIWIDGKREHSKAAEIYGTKGARLLTAF